MRSTLCILLALAVTGCGGGNDHDNGGTGGGTGGGGGTPGFTQIGSGADGNYNNTGDVFLVVRTHAAYTFLFCWTSQTNTFPVVDLAQNMVVAAILGDRPTSGYDIDFTNVTFSTDTATVDLTETTPGGVTLPVITRPYAFASMTSRTNVDIIKDLAFVGPATEITFDELVNAQFLLISNPLNFIATPAEQADLELNQCPIDQGPVTLATLNVNLSGLDVSNIAYYCADHCTYWVRHEQTAFVGTIVQWLGPFQP